MTQLKKSLNNNFNYIYSIFISYQWIKRYINLPLKWTVKHYNYLKVIFMIIMFITFIWLMIEDFTFLYCMDDRQELIQKIAKCKSDCEYYKQQLVGADLNFKEILKIKSQVNEEQFTKLFVEAKSALDDSNTNLNSETRALSYYQNKLDKGDFSLETTSTVQKRKASDD